MSSTTPNFNLKQDVTSDNIGQTISDLSSNMNIIDSEIQNRKNETTTNANNLVTHKASGDHDTRYYTQTQIDAPARDHKGTWQGFTPSQVDQTINSQVQINSNQIGILFKNSVSVLSFGADPTGNTDSTQAIQNAINSLSYSDNISFTPSMGVVYFPPGRYTVSQPINVKGDITIQGSGRYSTIISNTTTTQSTFVVVQSTGTNAGSGVCIRDLQINGSHYATAGNAIDVGYSFTTGSPQQFALNVDIERVNIFGHFNGIALGYVVIGRVDLCLIQKCAQDGFITSGTCNALSIRNTYSQNNVRHGYNFAEANYCSFFNTASDANGQNAYNLNNANRISMISCGAEQTGNIAVYVSTATSITLQDCFFNPVVNDILYFNNVTGATLINVDGLTNSSTAYGINIQGTTTNVTIIGGYLQAAAGWSNNFTNIVTINQANTTTPSLSVGTYNSANKVKFAVPLAVVSGTTQLNGTSAGYLLWAQDSQGTIKRFVAYLYGYENTTATAQTITFPTAFNSGAAILYQPSGFNATVSNTALTLPISMASAASGVIVVEGL